MKTIWKFQVPATHGSNSWNFSLDMPCGAKILCVQVQGTHQGGVPCIWAEVDEYGAHPKVMRHFAIYRTGWILPDEEDPPNRTYIGTFQLAGGALVFHLYELHPTGV